MNVLLRRERFATIHVPPCHAMTDLSAVIIECIPKMQHFFRNNNRFGKPTICWALVTYKFNKLLQLEGDQDLIESFVRIESIRHCAAPSTPARSTPARAALANPQSVMPCRPSRLPQPSSTTSTNTVPMCDECLRAPAVSMCLTENCPFHGYATCRLCFQANHPILTRNHIGIPLQNNQVKAILRMKNKIYCPQYASGPFAILFALYEAQQRHSQFYLVESMLKAKAQKCCRSNLYDKQARGQSAFACISNLAKEGYIQKEVVPGSEDERYSLLPKGEALAKFCYGFELAAKEVIKPCLLTPSSLLCVDILIDDREDKTFAARLQARCHENNVNCHKQALPAGDYLFVVDNKVMPIVVERKTWSDLADSIYGTATKQQRLQCLTNNICNSSCQLCRMKYSQSDRIMFIVEGARCLNRDSKPDKCIPGRWCKYCQELQDRHPGIGQRELEAQIYRLQAEHFCLLLFTRDYNETIMSLLLLHDILASTGKENKQASSSLPLTLTFDKFCSNVRSKKAAPRKIGGKVFDIKADDFIKLLHDGSVTEHIEQRIFGVPIGNKDFIDLTSDTSQCLDLSDSQSSILVLEDDGWEGVNTKPAVISLLIISGLPEYDFEYNNDLDKLWQGLYKVDRKNNSDFLELTKEKIIQMQRHLPLVQRESILFWVLYLQLRFNLIVHASRQLSCSTALSSLWGDTSISLSNCYDASKAKGSSLGALEVINQPADDVFPTPQSSQSPLYFGDSMVTKADYNKQAHIREARRRYFENNVTEVATTASLPSEDWSCPRCTYHNEKLNENCRMCDTPSNTNAGGMDQKLAPAGYSWICQYCDLKNSHENLKCEKCSKISSQLYDIDGEFHIQDLSLSFSSGPDVALTCLSQMQTMQKSEYQSSAGNKVQKVIRCGACGLFGHSRSNYNEMVCPKYNTDNEVQHRRKKEQAKEQKRQEEEEEFNNWKVLSEQHDAQLEKLLQSKQAVDQIYARKKQKLDKKRKKQA
jgi:hypothetical protein